MLEGLAVWALFIYLLRMIGMPWNKFTQSFKNVYCKIEPEDDEEPEFRGEDYYSGLIEWLISKYKMECAFLGYIKLTAKDYAFQILETVEEFKQEISDNNYKTVVDLLQKIHNL